MLVTLTIRDVVLIERLDLRFDEGLVVLTGETGAGKSILLDALGLALGARADAGLVRPGASQATVVAGFELHPGHPAETLLADPGIEIEDGSLVLRRQLGADGRSRAFVNDQPVSVGLLRALGDCLVEVQGHFEQRGLMDPGTHGDLLDAYAGLGAEAAKVADLWGGWRAAEAAAEEAAQRLDKARREEDFLRHAVAELDALEPQAGEAARLAEERALLMHAEQVIEALNAAYGELLGGSSRSGAESTLAAARRHLERSADKAGGRFDATIETLDRALAETEEAIAALQSLSADLEPDPGRLQAIDERYFALKDLARKHDVEVDALAAQRDELAARLEAIDGGSEMVRRLRAEAEAAAASYRAAAEALSKQRKAAAEALDAAIAVELPPLKLEKARFETCVERLDEENWGAGGIDRVSFTVATNPGAAPGPLGRIASAGELSRFLLALKVVLAETGSLDTLVFDEVDSGIGGATAHAVGERLARLAQKRQVLVVTHSPQVAARGQTHWRVCKTTDETRASTEVAHLEPAERREEIARMLSGASVTDEARAAAQRLMGAA